MRCGFSNLIGFSTTLGRAFDGNQLDDLANDYGGDFEKVEK